MILGFSKLRCSCLVGTYPHEKNTPQELLVTLTVSLPFQNQDQIEASVDYTQLASLTLEILQKQHHNLIETKAFLLLEALGKRFLLSSAKVRIEKPSAIPEAECAFVEMEKEYR